MPESAHVLVFPYPAQGHMIPLLDLAGHLAAAGVAVTIPVTPKNLHHLTSLLSAHPNSISPLLLPFPPHPSIPSGVENNADLPPSLFRSMMCAVAGLRRPLLDWFRRHPSPPSAIISDMFLGWVNRLAADLGIRSYAFFPSGAFAISFIRELWSEMPQRVNAGDEDEIVRFDGIPSSPVCAWWQITPVYRSYVKGDPDSEFIRDLFLGNFVSHGLIFNSFDGLEGVHLEYLAKKMGHDRVWAVGPLLPRIGPAERGGSSVVVASDIQSWLDKCQDHTVVYVYFGSQTMLANDQMKELISGLERSGVKFILSVKGATEGQNDDGMYGSIPEGFEARVADRGLLIKGWAPQVSILGHKAVCAFLTHCGWNSILESIVAGVPMLVWPMGADQYLNANLLVEHLDVAIRVCEGPSTVPESDDLVKFLEQVKSEKWAEKRNRTMALSKKALDAISVGGSSFKNLDSLAKVLAQK